MAGDNGKQVERLFCTACQSMRLAKNGQWTLSSKNRIRRWICNDCMQRKSPSIYSNKPKP